MNLRHERLLPLASRLLLGALGALLPSLTLYSCQSPDEPSVFEKLADSDGDGWFDLDSNQAVTLRIEAGRFPTPGEYRLVVDEVRFPLRSDLEGSFTVGTAGPERPTELGLDVAVRTVGANVIEHEGGVVPFRSRVRVQSLGPLGFFDVAVGAIDYTNEEASFQVQLGQVQLDCSTQRENFADPNPGDPLGDDDGDGIRERDEYVLCSQFRGLGDPREEGRDLVLVVGHTREPAEMLARTEELLRTRFRFENIRLHVDDGELNGVSGFGGFVTNDGVPLVANTALSRSDAAEVRDSVVPAQLAAFSRFALLDDQQVTCGEDLAFGCSSSTMRVIVAMSRISNYVTPAVSADVHDYQAKVLMHELGHTIGLCHPTLPCSSGPLPTAEQDPAGSVMGSPAENPPFDLGVISIVDPSQIINAFARPLDYSPTQWVNLDLSLGL